MFLNKITQLPLQKLQELEHVSSTFPGVESSHKGLVAQVASQKIMKSEHVVAFITSDKSHVVGKGSSWHPSG